MGSQLGSKSNTCLDLQEHITKFLASQSAHEGAAVTESEGNLSEHGAGDTVGDKRKRSAEDDSNAEPKVPKPSPGDKDFAVELSNSRQIRLSKFKGTLYVNIREWYDKDGELAPGKHNLLQLQIPQIASQTCATLVSFLFLQLYIATAVVPPHCPDLLISFPILHPH